MAKKAKTEKPKTPKARTLPGLAKARHTKLDRLCEQIGEVREDLNKAKGEDADLCRHALAYMHENKVPTYRFAGVELARVPGEEKLRVRSSKLAATTEMAKDDAETDGALSADDLGETVN